MNDKTIGEYIDSINQKHDKIAPAHYRQGGIECIDAMAAATVGKSGIEAICVSNVIRYLWRYELKGGLEDIRKARVYLTWLIEEIEGKKG